jgi:hypothetical protein
MRVDRQLRLLLGLSEERKGTDHEVYFDRECIGHCGLANRRAQWCSVTMDEAYSTSWEGPSTSIFSG